MQLDCQGVKTPSTARDSTEENRSEVWWFLLFRNVFARCRLSPVGSRTHTLWRVLKVVLATDLSGIPRSRDGAMLEHAVQLARMAIAAWPG